MNILVTFLDDKEPIYLDNNSFKSGNILKLISNGIIVPSLSKQIYFDKLVVVYSRQQKDKYKQLRECLTQLKKQKINIKLLIEESNEFSDINYSNNSLMYFYRYLSKVIKRIHVNYPDDIIYVNLSSGYSKVKMSNSLYLYNSSKENIKYLKCVDYQANSELSEIDLSLSNQYDLEKVDLQGIVDQDSSKILYNHIYFNNYSASKMILEDENTIISKSFKDGVNFMYYFTVKNNVDEAKKIYNNNDKLQTLLKKFKIINYLENDITFGKTNISNLICYLLMLDKYLIQQQYSQFTLFVSPCLFSTLLIALEKEKMETINMPRKVYFQDYSDFLYEVKDHNNLTKWKFNDNKIKELNSKNFLHGNDNSFEKYNPQSFASVSLLISLRNNLNYRNNVPNSSIVLSNNKYFDKFYEYEKEYRDQNKHNSYMDNEKIDLLENESNNLFDLILECINNNIDLDLSKQDFDLFYQTIKEFLLGKL